VNRRDASTVIDTTLFESALVQVGKFRCPASAPDFETASSPIEHYCFVFPRVAVSIEHDGRAPFIADPNTIPVYNAGRGFWRRHVRGGDDRSDWFGVAPDVLREILGEHDGQAADAANPFTFGWTPADDAVYLAQRRLYHYVRDTAEPDRLFVEEAVIGLATRILAGAYRGADTCERARQPAGRRLLVERAREHLAASFAANVSLGRLARDVGASVFHLCRAFKAQTGSTIHQYRTQLRVRHSLERLEQRPGDILATALDLGFSGHSHYTSTFHAAFGLAPSAFTSAVGARKRQC
jgi:AraC-like DNA-binding protein